MRIRFKRKKKRMKGLPLNASNDQIKDYVGQRNLEALERMGQKEAYLRPKMAFGFGVAKKVDKEMKGK